MRVTTKIDKRVTGIQSHRTLCKPNVLITKPISNSDEISIKYQKFLWSRIRMLSYLIKHLRPDTTNTTWDLSKDGMNTATFLKMHHVIKYALHTRNLGLRIEQNET